MAPGVCGNGSVPLSHSGNVVTRIGIHTHILRSKCKYQRKVSKDCFYSCNEAELQNFTFVIFQKTIIPCMNVTSGLTESRQTHLKTNTVNQYYTKTMI